MKNYCKNRYKRLLANSKKEKSKKIMAKSTLAFRTVSKQKIDALAKNAGITTSEWLDLVVEHAISNNVLVKKATIISVKYK